MNVMTSLYEGITYEFWNGQELRSPVAFDTETTVVEDLARECPRFVLASVSDGVSHYIIPRNKLYEFLLAHQSHEFIGHNVAFDFWVVYEELQKQLADPIVCPTYIEEIEHAYDKAEIAYSLTTWWKTADEGRFHDTMILDMLVRLARGEGETGSEDGGLFPKNLELLASRYAPQVGVSKKDQYRLRYGELLGRDSWDDVEPGFFAYAVKDTWATWEVYQKLREEALALHQKFSKEFYPDAWSDYGLLTEKVQVLGAISLLKISRNGIRIDKAKAAGIEQGYRDELKQHLDFLMKQYPKLFKFKKKTGQVILTKKGQTPSMSKLELQKLLWELGNGFKSTEPTEYHEGDEEPFTVPISQGKKKEISTSVKAWGPYQDRHPFLGAWCKHGYLTKLIGFFDLFKKEGDRIHPEYNALLRTGRCSCSRPNLQQIPRLAEFRSVFVAREGEKLMTIDYAAIELRTLAAVCKLRFGESVLGKVISEGRDPHAYTASMFEKGLDYEQFLALKTLDPKSFKARRQAAKAVNFGVPGGLGPLKLSQYAKAQYGVDLSVEEAATFRKKLITEIYPELNETTGYLANTTLRDLAENLQVPRELIEERLRKSRRPVSMSLYCMEKVARGTPVKADGTPYEESFCRDLWSTLRHLVEMSRTFPASLKEQVKNQVGSTTLRNRVFFATAAVPTGRIRGGVGFTQARNSPFQGLAADGAKLAMWELLKHGFRVVLMVHDEVVVEVDNDDQALEVKELMESAMFKVLAGSVPVETEYSLGDCWSKG